MQSNPNLSLNVFLLICVSSLLGCSSATVADVEGIVTLDGAPLAEIRVIFQPENKSSETAAVGSFGLTDSSGKFELKLSDGSSNGAAVGKHTVILADKLAEDAADSDAGVSKAPKSRIPARYGKKELVFEVKPGTQNQAKLELTTK